MSNRYNQNTDIETLENQVINKGRSVKQVAQEQGYSNPSAVYRRLQRHGWQKLSKISFQDWGGATLSLDTETLEKSLKLKNFNREESVFFEPEVITEKESSADLSPGDIVLKTRNRKWVNKKP